MTKIEALLDIMDKYRNLNPPGAGEPFPKEVVARYALEALPELREAVWPRTSVKKRFKVGFVGTRRGMTSGQWDNLFVFLIALCPQEVHCGTSAAADREFDALVREILPETLIVHPPPCAYCKGEAIVDATDFLLTVPAEYPEVLKSDTWTTIRYARERGKKVYILAPPKTNGSTA